MTTLPDVCETQNNLIQEILVLKSKPGLFVTISLVLIGFLFCYFASDSITPLVWVSWLIALLAMALVRGIFESNIFSNETITIQNKVKISLVLTLISGIVHGSSLVFFPFFTLYEQAIQTLILLGLISGAIATNSGYLPLYLAYITPIIIPLTIVWGINVNEISSWQSSTGIALLILVFTIIQITNARNYYARFIELYNARSKLEKAIEKEVFLREDADFANSSKTRFLASASHDLRQPIQTLLLLVGNLSNQSQETTSKKTIESIESTCINLSSLLDSLLDISKLDAGLMESSPTNIDLVWVLTRINSEFQHDALVKNIQLTFDSETEEAWTETDSDLVSRIFRNLISNAIKYTERGQITIKLADTNKGWTFSIKDTGLGIPEDKHDQIFEEFYQIGNDQRNRENGLGLGLAIVKRLLDNLNLSIKMDSTLGEGTEFSIEFIKAHAPSNQASINIPSEGNNSIRGTHILCIDDEKAILEALGETLKGMGCTVDLTDNVQECILLAERRRPDIVLADFRLAGSQNGIDVITSIKTIYPNLPALLISGDTAPDRLQHASSAGVIMLHKPLHPNKIKTAIFNALEAL